MRQYKNNYKRRFRSSNDRNFTRNLDSQSLVSNTNFQRKPHRINNQSASRLIEKYTNLAREALTTGDKILSESYYQFSDHYLRVLNEREKNQSSINFDKEKSINEKSESDKASKDQKFDEKKVVTS